MQMKRRRRRRDIVRHRVIGGSGARVVLGREPAVGAGKAKILRRVLGVPLAQVRLRLLLPAGGLVVPAITLPGVQEASPAAVDASLSWLDASLRSLDALLRSSAVSLSAL